MDIIIDTKGDSGLINKDQLLDNDNEEIKIGKYTHSFFIFL